MCKAYNLEMTYVPASRNAFQRLVGMLALHVNQNTVWNT